MILEHSRSKWGNSFGKKGITRNKVSHCWFKETFRMVLRKIYLYLYDLLVRSIYILQCYIETFNYLNKGSLLNVFALTVGSGGTIILYLLSGKIIDPLLA